jgi:hypothetical protein
MKNKGYVTTVIICAAVIAVACILFSILYNWVWYGGL